MRKIYYGWIVVAITALTLLVSAGVRSAPGVFLKPMVGDLQTTTALLSFAVSLGLLLFGLAGPVSGWLIGRIGPRRMMVAGMLILAVSMAMSARMQREWELFLFWGVLSGIGTGVASAVLGAAVANRWFVKQRGLVIGIFGAATSAGQLIFTPLLMQLMTTYGWRFSVMVLAGVTLTIALPITLLMRDDPSAVGLQPYGAVDTPARTEAQSTRGIMRQAVVSPTFWLLAATFFICGATSNGLIGTHLIPFAMDCGLGPTIAASVMAIMGMCNFVGTIGSGWLTDRFDPRKLLCVYYAFRGVSLLFLPFVNTPTGFTIFAILFGLDYIATVPPTTALVADTFGRKHVGTVFGWIFCAHQIGAALATWLGGLARDIFGSYGTAFFIGGLLAVVAAGLALTIGRWNRQTELIAYPV